MPTPRLRAVIFDAYGTLLDFHSAMARHATALGPDWQRISQEWRAKQMEYTWVRSLTGPAYHRGFWQLTRAALEHVATVHGITDTAMLDAVLQSYRKLDAFPDVPPMLTRLREMGIPRAILSNGSPDMLSDAVTAAGIRGLLDDVLSAAPAGVFKPSPLVYRLATRRFDAAPGELAFVSANPWDAFGAQAFGFRVFRVNRTGRPDEYGLDGVAPVLPDMAALADRLKV